MSNYDLSDWPLFRAVIDEDSVNRNKSRSCVVLCPDSDRDGDLQRHAKVVLKYIIQPALIDSMYAAHRPALSGDGSILSDAGIEAVLRDDLVIAVMTGRNPEIFYQVAIAQAAGRPLILMIEQGAELAIQPRGALVISYSIDTDAILSAAGVRELNAAVVQFQGDSPPVQEGFSIRKAMPRNVTSGANTLLLDRGGDFTYDQRMAMMREASSRIDILGVANASLARHPDMIDLVKSRSGHDLHIRILQTAPGNPGIGALVGSRDADRTLSVRNEIDAACEAWKHLCQLDGLDLAISVRLAQDAVPLSYAVITEKAVVATPYQFSRAANDSPSIHATAGARYHTVMLEEFDALWQTASPFLRRERASGDGASEETTARDDRSFGARFRPSNDQSPGGRSGRRDLNR